MKTLADRIKAADALLAPYAVPLEGTLGRAHPDLGDETRFPFQRDRDRIVHTQAFRRLKGKTQVFVIGQGDHFRTRLTHTMEVAVISRDIARTLGLNEDLAECIALAHDLGHPPFGHAGEEALDAWMRAFGFTFEHNEQSYRIVTILENHTTLYDGMNLNREVLDGLLKHRTPHDAPGGAPGRSPSLEAQIVNLADEIAYTCHDCDDGLRARLFQTDDLLTVPLALQAYEQAQARGTPVRSSLIHFLVTDLYTETEKQCGFHRINTLEDIYATGDPIARFSAEITEKLAALRAFLWDHMYLNSTVLEKGKEGKNIIRKLCDSYLEKPTQKIIELNGRSHGALSEAVKDYVAGMTDEYAIKSFREIGPS